LVLALYLICLKSSWFLFVCFFEKKKKKKKKKKRKEKKQVKELISLKIKTDEGIFI
jgi:16S rRNA C1402 (ribose-2'-O) methylase RsmI